MFGYLHNNNNSIKFFIINVPSQQLQRQLQTQHSVHIGNNNKVKSHRIIIIIIVLIIIIQFKANYKVNATKEKKQNTQTIYKRRLI
jgi:hypothetical protein